MDKITEQFKKGWKTSEFWVAIVTPGLLLVNGLTGLDLDAAEVGGLVGTGVAYVVGRSYLKGKRAEAVGDVVAYGKN